MDARIAVTRLQQSISVALICSDADANYRRDLLQQELVTLDAASQDALLERVLGGLGHTDPLVALMHGAA
jgi:hypothetical protein